jgi:hypothetical protein
VFMRVEEVDSESKADEDEDKLKLHQEISSLLFPLAGAKLKDSFN